MSRNESELLGENYQTARHTLTRMLLFNGLQDKTCYRCREDIDTWQELSIEHKTPWRSATSPSSVFYDLADITFSHLDCNRREGAVQSGKKSSEKTHCPKGHEYTEENTYWYQGRSRQCRQCNRCRQSEWQQRRGKAAIGVGNPS